jgi:hypothetical protein
MFIENIRYPNIPLITINMAKLAKPINIPSVSHICYSISHMKFLKQHPSEPPATCCRLGVGCAAMHSDGGLLHQALHCWPQIPGCRKWNKNWSRENMHLSHKNCDWKHDNDWSPENGDFSHGNMHSSHKNNIYIYRFKRSQNQNLTLETIDLNHENRDLAHENWGFSMNLRISAMKIVIQDMNRFISSKKLDLRLRHVI